MKTLKIEDLSKNFGSTEVLKKINLEIDEGNFLVLLGPSGCGKSTLLNIIAGLETINEGNVYIDDYNVSKRLLEKVVESGKKNKLKYMEGPMGFSNLDKVGVLTSGFDVIGTMITSYNHSYYKNHYEKFGLTPEKNFHEKTFMFEDIDTTYYEKMSRIVKTRNKLNEVNFNSTSEVMKRTNEMFDLFNKSYEKLSSFVKISDDQKEFMKEKYIKFINPEYIKYFKLSPANQIIANPLPAIKIAVPKSGWVITK